MRKFPGPLVWTSFPFERDEKHIEAERALDGIYVLRSDLPKRKLSAEEEPVSSFQDLLGQLGTIVRNRVRAKGQKDAGEFEMTSTPTALQTKALELLGVSLRV